MVADDEAVSACLHDGVPDCAAAETLLHVIEDAKAHQAKALIAYINRAINLLIDQHPSAWVGALEVFTFADGDCKAYSIAKFFALREAGLPAERLRLVIVGNRRRSEDHMVVAANVEDAWFILDNAPTARTLRATHPCCYSTKPAYAAINRREHPSSVCRFIARLESWS